MLKGRVILSNGQEHKFQVTAENWIQWGTSDNRRTGAAVDILSAAQEAIAEEQE
jgi:hypothetical protein